MKTTMYLSKFRSVGYLLATCAVVSCSDNEELLMTETDALLNEDPVLTKGDQEDGQRAKVSESSSVCNPGAGGPREYLYSGPGTDVNKTNVSTTATIDDRTCAYNYTQTSFSGRTHGVYKLKANSNHIDDLQPRIERSSQVINSTNSGSYVKISGYVTIRRAGHKSDNYGRGDMRDNSGTYIAQAKGKHTGGGGSPDPAIALIVAKPRFSGGQQVSYDIYREQIKYRGGSGPSGRKLVYLTNIPKNSRKFFRMETGFTGSGSNKRHYVNVRIGGTDYNWNVPEPNRATQAKIRFGAYRCKGGEADILWDGMSQTYNVN